MGADGPPRETGTFRQADLVELVALDPTIRLDVRYATANNFVGRPVYTEARAFLQRPAAEALVRAHRALREQGYGLLVFDGYRPWAVTKLFWDVTPPAQREFVANPKQGSKHNRGCAVDLSLYDLATGREVEMPSAYDEMSERSHPFVRGRHRGPARRPGPPARAPWRRKASPSSPTSGGTSTTGTGGPIPILDVPFSATSARD